MSEKITPQQLVSQQLSQLTQLEALLAAEKDILLTGDIANWLANINSFINILHPLKWGSKWKK